MFVTKPARAIESFRANSVLSIRRFAIVALTGVVHFAYR